MKYKSIISLVLAIALILGCTGWTPAVAQQTQTESVDQTGLSSVPADAGQALKSDILPQIGTQKEAELRHVARLRGEETLDTHVYLNNDGTKTLYCYDHPVQYLDEQGKMCDISLDIADTTDVKYPFRTKANSAVTFFPASLSDGVKLGGNGVELRLAAQLPLSTNKKQSVRRLNDQTVSYTYDANTTIEYTLTYTGFKEDIVVNTYTGQTEYSFVLYTNGLALTELDGSYYLTDDAGDIQASIGDVIVFTADERNNTFGQMRAETIEPKQQYSMTIVLDAEYLADPKTAYPIRIDPTVSLTYAESGADSIADVTIHSNYTSGGERTYLILGPWDVEDISRILMKFPGIDFSAYEGVTITSAIVSLRDLMCESTQLGMYCYPFTGSAWEEGTVSWENVTQSWGDLLDSHIISYYAEDGSVSSHRYEFEIKEAVQAWVDGDPTITPEKGIIFKASDEIENGTTLEYRTFGSFERDSYKPFFTMTYQSGITLSQSSATVYKGETIELTATTAPAGQAVTWASDAPTVASVDENGVVTGLSAGTATITATLEDGTIAACTIEVLAKIIDFRYNTNTEVYKGNTVTLTPYTEPADEPVTWTSLDPDIASVTQEGVVTGVSPGNAVIRASLSDGTYADCEVVVLATNIFFECVCGSECAEDCTCGCTSINLYVEETVTLTATTVPPGMPVTWVSLNPSIATVVDGVVTGISVGETKILARLDEYTFAECTVNIRAWQINWDESSIKIAVGDPYTFVTTTTPLGKHITWSSSDTTIATVSQSGEVNALKCGDVIITATLADGTSESCVVKVRYRGSFPFSTIDLIDGEGQLLLLNTEEPIEVTWTSSNSNIATVNENGYVQSKNPGIVRITANSPDLLQSVTCEVNVRLMRSMYTLKNLSSNLQMAPRDYGIVAGTRVIQQVSDSENTAEAYSKIWKIYYLGNGYYSIRPAHKLNLGLLAHKSKATLVDLGFDDTADKLPAAAQWSITVTTTGDLIIENKNYPGRVLMPQDGSTDAYVQLVCAIVPDSSSIYMWRYSGITVEPKILLYNVSTEKYLKNTRIGAFINETLSLVTASVVSNTGLYHVDWMSSAQNIVDINEDGSVCTNNYGVATLTASAHIAGYIDQFEATYTIVVSKIKITGYEKDYQPELWKSPDVKSLNCFSYALNAQYHPLYKGDDGKKIIDRLQPGFACGMDLESSMMADNSDGEPPFNIVDMLKRDSEQYRSVHPEYPEFYFVPKNDVTEIPEGAYLIALCVAENQSYHFYRQNSDGTWSHKNDRTPVSNVDGAGDIIYDPKAANHNYGPTAQNPYRQGYDYSVFLGYFYVIPFDSLVG